MPIKVQCRSCQASFQAADQHAGKTAKCPSCQQPLQIPAAQAAVAKMKTASQQVAPAKSAKQVTAAKPKSKAATAAPIDNQADVAKQLLDGLQGSIKRTRPTIAYQLAALVVAVVMSLLPLIYIGLIFLAGYGVYYHAVNHTVMLNSNVRGRGYLFVILAYLAPLVCGMVLVVFMIKPLFARPAHNVRTRSINREREPLLFAFIDRICEIVGAAKPKRIDLDCQVNASASFRRGMLSMLGNDLVLTIGMPLVAGLNTRQFAGVLAHEFGHFAQGAGMRLTYIIRSISFWLARVVYQRDAADEWLANTAAETDIRISWVLYLAMLFVWVSRKILWVLMVIGHFVGSYLLRQMEFDADRYETRLAGGKAFTQTVHQLHFLNIATQGAYSDLREFYREGRLGDDLPRLIMSKAGQISADNKKKIIKSIDDTETGWLDTHPADKDRIANAEREQTDGIFHVELPSSVLFTDFEAQSKATTWEFYREQFGNNLDRNRLRPVSEMLAKQESDRAAEVSLERFFQGQWSVFLPLQVSTECLKPPADAKQTLAKLKSVRQQMLDKVEAVKPAYETIGAEQSEWVTAVQLRHCLRAGINVKPDGQKTSEGQQRQRAELAAKKIGHARQVAAEYQQLSAQRLALGLQLLYVPQVAERIQNAGKWQRDSEKVLSCLRALGDQMETLLECSRLHAAAGTLFEFLSDNNDESLIIVIQDLAEKLTPITKQLHTVWSKQPYPYQHAERHLTLGGYLVPTVPIKDDLASVFNAADQIVDGAYNLYVRCLGDLITRVEAVETAVGLEQLKLAEKSA